MLQKNIFSLPLPLSSKKIGVDVRLFAEERKSGVEEYTKNVLIKTFQENPTKKFYLFYNAFNKKNPSIFKIFTAYPNVFLKRFYFPNKLFNLLFYFFNFPKLDKILKVDSFFAPNINFIALSKKNFFILTVHDLSFERHQEFFNFYRLFWHFLVNPKKIVRRANRILTVSTSSKNDLITIYHLSPKKISVFYPPLDSDFINNKAKKQKKPLRIKYFPFKYLLTLGTLEPRKNIESLIIVFEKLKKENLIQHKLVIVGARGWLFNSTNTLLNSLSFKEDIIFTGQINNQDRLSVYQKASLFIYPSFFEGFGFPPKEAIACKIPTVCSFSSSLPEVVKNNAWLFDPYNREELYWTLKAILVNNRC